MPPRSRIEVKGLEAKHYDILMKLITIGKYSRFIRQAIADINLNDDDIIADLGAGTGKNAGLMLDHLGPNGKVFAVEIGEEMRKQLAKKQAVEPRLEIINQRIEQTFQLPQPATVGFMSFVIHGFEQADRLSIIKNIRQNLVPEGRFCILDYNHFNIDKSPWYVRFGIRKVECELAEDFILKDWQTILSENGFSPENEHYYFDGVVRLLCSRKK